ncbi:MAG: hypothetical protein V1262_13025, partial [Alphaproteobacteria bacterium]|nr:hypothetical protein [Alphaproteobacteria bacterium]
MTETPAIDPTDLMWEYLKGFHAVHHMAIGNELGLFAKINEAGEGGRTPASLAADLDLHGLYVDVWCKTGYHYGLLEEGEAGCFVLAEMMDKLLVNAGD